MISVVIPAHNEQDSVAEVVQSLTIELNKTEIAHEIIVVDDGSADATAERVKDSGATLLQHPDARGYGQAIRTGMAAAKYEFIAIIDSDGSYRASDMAMLCSEVQKHGADHIDMIVGSRSGTHYRGGPIKVFSRGVLISLCEFVAGTKIPDINSGLRIFRKSLATLFLNQLSFGFSFTTSITLCFLLNGFLVRYVPISYDERSGHSKVSYFRDTLRTLQYVFEAFARYNPFKLFMLVLYALIMYGLFAAIGLVSGCGSVQVWLLGAILLGTASIVIGMSFLAVILSNRLERTTL